jgi:hypothetical protein
MSLGHNITIYSDDEEDDIDHTKQMLEPGYVSTVRDEQVKHKRGLLGVRTSAPFSSQELIHCRTTPFWHGYLRLMSLFKSFSDMRAAVTLMSLAHPVMNIKVTSDVSIVMILGCFVLHAHLTTTLHVCFIESRYVFWWLSYHRNGTGHFSRQLL